MRMNDDGKTVGAMDILFPGIGEIIGGSQREERYDVLLNRMKEMNIPEEEMSWYLDTRRFGTCPHAGLWLGLRKNDSFCYRNGEHTRCYSFSKVSWKCRILRHN